MIINSINHHSRRDSTLTEFQASVTDQSQALDSDINTIVARYKQTGIFPDISKTASQFIDCTTVTSFQDAHNQISEAKSLFNQFPAHIRALMDNNPAKAEQFLSDPRNLPLMEKYGLATITPPTPPVIDPTEPLKGSKATSKKVETDNPSDPPPAGK